MGPSMRRVAFSSQTKTAIAMDIRLAMVDYYCDVDEPIFV